MRVKQLECFQGELAKRALKWLKHHSNTAAVVVLGLPSVRCAVLMRKLGLLLKLGDEEAEGVGVCAFRSLMDDVFCLFGQIVQGARSTLVF